MLSSLHLLPTAPSRHTPAVISSTFVRFNAHVIVQKRAGKVRDVKGGVVVEIPQAMRCGAADDGVAVAGQWLKRCSSTVADAADPTTRAKHLDVRVSVRHVGEEAGVGDALWQWLLLVSRVPSSSPKL